MKEKTKPRIKKQNRKKGLLSLIAASLALLTLSSCATTYTAKINGGNGTGEWVPPVSGDWGELGSGSGEGGYSDLFDNLGDFDPSHLFSKNSFDPSALAGLAGLAGMGDMAEKLKDFSGFTQGDAYFIADFDANPSKYSGAGKFLFAKNKVFSKEERDELMKELSADKIILASYKADSEGLPVEEYAVYPADENLAQIYISRKNPETGEKELLLYNYVSTPVNGELPVLPGEQVPDLSGLEQGERYSTRWLEWLIYEDRGSIYPMVENGSLYASRYDNNPQYTYSPWSIRTEGITARFALSLGLDGQEFSYADETGERFIWKVFYRDDKGGFSAAGSSHPWKIKRLDSGYYRIELDLFNYGLNMMLKEDGSNNSYETVFIIEDTEGRILCWYADEVDWTDSSEAYYKQAVETGIQEDHRGQVPVIPEKEPLNVFSPEWLSWLVDEDKGNTYPKTELQPSTGTFSPTLDPSAFLIWPYDGVTGSVYKTSRFGLALAVDHNAADYTEGVGKKTLPRYVWTYGYREVGQEDFLFAADMQDNCTPYGYALYGDTCIYYLDLLNYGMLPSLKKGGLPTSYEIVFVIRDRENDSEVVGWQSTVVEWNASARAYYDKAVELGIQKDVLRNLGEPANQRSNNWVNWLLETDGSDYPQFESIKLGSHVYKTGMSASPFYAQNKLFCLGVDCLQAQTMNMIKYRIFYREKGSSDAYRLLETTLKNKTSKTLNSEGLTEYSFDMVIRDPEMIFAEAEYEAVFVSLDISQNVLGWGEVDFSYNASSEGFRKEVLALRPETVEPAQKDTVAWVNWLLTEKNHGYSLLKTLAFGERRYAPTMEPSPFYINDNKFCMEIYVESELIPLEQCMIFCKKKNESSYKYEGTHYVRNLRSSSLEDNLRGTWFELEINTRTSFLVQQQASYDVVVVCCDLGGNVSGWGTGSFEYNDSSDVFYQVYQGGKIDGPADRYSDEWAKWLKTSDKPQFSFASFEMITDPPFRIRNGYYCMSVYLQTKNSTGNMTSFRVFYRESGTNDAYRCFDAPIYKTEGERYALQIDLSLDPRESYFSTGSAGGRKYDVLLVALNVIGDVSSWVEGSFTYTDAAEAVRQKALAQGLPVPIEPSVKNSDEWVEWMLTYGEKVYPRFESLSMSEHRFEEGMAPSPFYIREDLTSKTYVLEFKATVNPALSPITAVRLCYKQKGGEDGYLFMDPSLMEAVPLSSTEVLYRVALNPKRYYFRMQNGEPAQYELLLIGLYGNTVVQWQSTELVWNQSAESFRALAESTGAYYGAVENTGMRPTRYSLYWSEWLKANYESIKVEKFTAKPWSGLTHGGGEESSSICIYEGKLCLGVKYELGRDLSAGLSSGEHPYKWRLYYRAKGSVGKYTLTMLEPLAMGSTKEMLFFDLGGCDPAFRFPEGTEIDGYEMILVVSSATDDLPLCFCTFNVSWNDSSVYFYKDALQYGYLQEKED